MSTVSHQVAVEGDTVTVQYKCMNNKGEVCCTVIDFLLSPHSAVHAYTGHTIGLFMSQYN